MSETPLPAILCVDDEPQVLSGLNLHLRRHFEVLTATSGAEALALLQTRRDVQAIMSDMRMPVMDGANFLRQARALLPDAPRMLLTGHADIDAAISAVNNGQIFRFLIKPCPPDVVLATFQAACAQYRLVTAERVLLGNTLNGTIKTLIDVLAMSSPLAFGRATRIKKLAGELAAEILPQQRWAVEMAAMLAPLGAISLPDNVAEKMYGGRLMSPDEQRMVERIPKLTESLLGQIPRLELVRAIMSQVDGLPLPTGYRPDKDEQLAIQRGADVLRVALDFDVIDAEGQPADVALATLRSRSGRYDPAVLASLAALRGSGNRALREIHEIPIHALRAGMVIAVDVRLGNGTLLLARGMEVTESLVERISNLRLHHLAAPLRVYLPRGA